MMWLSSPTMTGQVDTSLKGIIVDTPPIWRKFVGQYWKRLYDWLAKKFGTQNIKAVYLDSFKNADQQQK